MPRRLAPILFLLLSAVAISAQAAGFRSVSEATVLYDTPSVKGRKLFIAPPGMPVQVVVALNDWVKVRDASGDLSWIEQQALNEQRTVVTTVHASVRLAPSDMSTEVFQIGKGVVLELIEAPAAVTSVPARATSATPEGWAQVRHADGQTGYIRAAEIWGL